MDSNQYLPPTEDLLERLPYSASPNEIRFEADILAIRSIAHSLPLFATAISIRHLRIYLKHVVPIILMLALTSCVAPSMTIYGRGVKTDRYGNQSVVAVKEFQMYSDSIGRTTVQGSRVAFTSEGGVYNSVVIRESGTFAAKVGRSIIQPIASWFGIGAVAGDAINQAGSQAGSVFSP